MNRLGPALLILAGVLLVVFVAVYAFVTISWEQPRAAPLPPDLSGLARTRTSAGKGAADEINRLHQNEFRLTSAAVGVYGPAQATLWVAGAPLSLFAERMLVEMEERIAEGKSPFTPTGERKEGKRTIYELDGFGQKHFYFRSNNLLIWLAADAELAEQALIQTLEYYR